MLRYKVEFPDIYVDGRDEDDAEDNAWHLMKELGTTDYILTEMNDED